MECAAIVSTVKLDRPVKEYNAIHGAGCLRLRVTSSSTFPSISLGCTIIPSSKANQGSTLLPADDIDDIDNDEYGSGVPSCRVPAL
jgi:hypothetical protein